MGFAAFSHGFPTVSPLTHGNPDSLPRSKNPAAPRPPPLRHCPPETYKALETAPAAGREGPAKILRRRGLNFVENDKGLRDVFVDFCALVW